MTDTLLEKFPVRIRIPVAWGEMDSFGHVNNIIYFRYFESARIAYFEKIGFQESYRSSKIGPILAETHCRFKAPLTYPDEVTVGARARDLEDDRFMMDYSVVSEAQAVVVASGTGRIVAYDYNTLGKTRVPESVRAAIDAIED